MYGWVLNGWKRRTAMAGSTLGNIFKITTWGESHGKALGVVVDGCPAGLPLSEEDIQKYLDRRKPGTSAITTQRKEADQVEILSGVFDGKTTGTPISLMVRNTSQISADYSEIAENYRPGHDSSPFSTVQNLTHAFAKAHDELCVLVAAQLILLIYGAVTLFESPYES
jgi:hypothetical protein